MKIIETGTHSEICGGQSNTYKVILDTPNPTVEDALKEIKKYTNNDSRFTPIEDYGCKDIEKTSSNWGIYINDDVYISSWSEPLYRKTYNGDTKEIVFDIKGEGGWYCGINFYIYSFPFEPECPDQISNIPNNLLF